MSKTVSALKMKRLDADCIKRYRIPGLLLMENAGRSVSDEIVKKIKQKNTRFDRKVSIFCGRGNNGGDGMVCARHLLVRKIPTQVYLVGEGYSVKGETLVNLEILRRLGCPLISIQTKKSLDHSILSVSRGIVVDALFGIGFKGIASGLLEDLICAINSTDSYKVSIDLPSGLDATTGIVKGECIKADLTVTMGLPKTGLCKKDGMRYAGEVRVRDIGIPFPTQEGLNRRDAKCLI